MKNLDSANLRRYKVENPLETEAGFKTFFPGSKVYAYEFPKDDGRTIKSLVSTHSVFGIKSTRISMSIENVEEQTIDTVGIEELYLVQGHLQRQDECFVWQYQQKLQQMREMAYKAAKGVDFDLRHGPVQVLEYVSGIPLLEQAYQAKMQKNGKYTYGKGAIGQWNFVHVKADDEFPWEVLQAVAERVFKNNLVQVFFNEETRKHPGEFVLWYHPSVRPII